MSNLKKVLAMVLAAAMLLSMGLTAGAGAFADVKDTDDYARAINLLASLEVLKGFEDGTYNATGTYTREQFAKILYVLMNGKDDGAAMYSGTSPFTDVAADRWSAGYITWAKNAKVIGGREDGLFWPTDIVTYAEAAKMFVVAMGYDSTVYTFPYGFIDKAQSLKLFDDVKGMTANGPANRGTVAQMAFNALFAPAPRFGTYAAQIGSSSTTATETYTVAQGAFGMVEDTGYLRGTSTYALDEDFTDEGQVYLYPDKHKFKEGPDEESLYGLYDYEGNVDAYVGCKVAVWYKPAKTSNDKDMIFDIQPASSCKVIEFTTADVKSATDDYELVVKLGGVEKTYDYYSGDGVSSIGADVSLNADLFEGKYNTAASFKAIDFDGDSELDYVIVTFADTAKVSALTSTRVSFTSVKAGEVLESGTKDIKEDDVVIYKLASGIAKSDYVIATAHNEFTEEGMQTIFDVTKATEIDGAKLSKISSGDFYFDGTVYTAAGEANLTGDDDFEAVGKVGNKYDLVLNANGDIVFCTKVASVVSKDKWILAMDLGISTKLVGGLPVYELKTITGYLADGTKKTFSVDSDLVVDGIDIDTEDDDEYAFLANDVIYQYALNSDGEIDTLKTAAYVADEKDYGYDATGLATYSTSTTILKVDALTGYVDDDSVVFFKTAAGKYSVIAASELKKITTGITGNMFVVDDDSAAVIVLLSGATKPVKVDESFGYILWAEKEVSGDDYVYTFSVAYDGKVETVKTDAVEDDYEGFDSYVNLDDTIGFMKLVFDTNGFLKDLEAIDSADLVSVSPTKILSGAMMGNVIENGDIITDGADDAIDYAVDADATLAALSNNSFADEVYYYLVSDFPVNASGADIGCLDYDVDVAVSDKDSINTSGSTLTYVVTVIYNSDNEIESVFIYSDAVRTVEVAP